MNPDFEYDVPSPESLSLSKCSNAAFIIDTCNQAHKSRSFLADKVKEKGKMNVRCKLLLLVQFITQNSSASTMTDHMNSKIKLEIDCWNHLRNV